LRWHAGSWGGATQLCSPTSHWAEVWPSYENNAQSMFPEGDWKAPVPVKRAAGAGGGVTVTVTGGGGGVTVTGAAGAVEVAVAGLAGAV
jgi:hypothetical protein